MSIHPMASCSSGATFAGVPCQLRTSQALICAGSSAGPAITRPGCDADAVAICTPSSSSSSLARAPVQTHLPRQLHLADPTRPGRHACVDSDGRAVRNGRL